jgi:hypothetical protein
VGSTASTGWIQCRKRKAFQLEKNCQQIQNYTEISTLLKNMGLPHEQLYVCDRTSLTIKQLLAIKEAMDK